MSDKRLSLGLVPEGNVCGWGVISFSDTAVSFVDSGVLVLDADAGETLRSYAGLARFQKESEGLLKRYPLETVTFQGLLDADVKVAFVSGQVAGIAVLSSPPETYLGLDLKGESALSEQVELQIPACSFREHVAFIKGAQEAVMSLPLVDAGVNRLTLSFCAMGRFLKTSQYEDVPDVPYRLGGTAGYAWEDALGRFLSKSLALSDDNLSPFPEARGALYAALAGSAVIVNRLL